MSGSAEGPSTSGECFAWTYSYERITNGIATGGSNAAAYDAHSYAYAGKGQLLDYSATDGQYKLWSIVRPPRPGCPGVEWPPAASGTLAVKKHLLVAVSSGVSDAFSLLDYDPLNGDYRLGVCNRTVTNAASHLDCHTSSNGTWHTCALQLLYVGDGTMMRYSKTTGQYSLWSYHSANDLGEAAFGGAPLTEGSLLKKDGTKLKGASLTYLDAGELLATVPSTGYVALYRRQTVSPQLAAESWAMVPESTLGEGVAPVDGFAHRWEASSILRGWQFSYVGQQTFMMLKPATGSYRLLNCSEEVYCAGSPKAATEGPPCSLLVEGQLPTFAPCEHTKDKCLLAPHCGWCESSSKCVAANEDGVCYGGCPDGQLLYLSSSWQPEALVERAVGGGEMVEPVLLGMESGLRSNERRK